jgi:hypothetical protein
MENWENYFDLTHIDCMTKIGQQTNAYVVDDLRAVGVYVFRSRSVSKGAEHVHHTRSSEREGGGSGASFMGLDSMIIGHGHSSRTGSLFVANPMKGAIPTNFVSRFCMPPLAQTERFLNATQWFGVLLICNVCQVDTRLKFWCLKLFCQAVRDFHVCLCWLWLCFNVFDSGCFVPHVS